MNKHHANLWRTITHYQWVRTDTHFYPNGTKMRRYLRFQRPRHEIRINRRQAPFHPEVYSALEFVLRKLKNHRYPNRKSQVPPLITSDIFVSPTISAICSEKFPIPENNQFSSPKTISSPFLTFANFSTPKMNKFSPAMYFYPLWRHWKPGKTLMKTAHTNHQEMNW